jgi:hypothetical protein
MARKIRLEYAGATYHVMARGNQGRDIYAADQDRKLWLATLAEACEPLSRGRRGSYSGEAKREHGEAEADRLVRLGLPLVGLGESDLAVLPKGGIEKQVLAWWLCQHTVVGRRWVSERLNMGDESRVTQALRRTKAAPEPAVEALKERLESAYAVGVTRA